MVVHSAWETQHGSQHNPHVIKLRGGRLHLLSPSLTSVLLEQLRLSSMVSGRPAVFFDEATVTKAYCEIRAKLNSDSGSRFSMGTP